MNDNPNPTKMCQNFCEIANPAIMNAENELRMDINEEPRASVDILNEELNVDVDVNVNTTKQRVKMWKQRMTAHFEVGMRLV